MKKIIFLLYVIFIAVLISKLTSIFLFPNYNLGDYWIYHNAIDRYLRNENFYIEYFGYFPSFFLLAPLVYIGEIYAFFLIVLAFLSFIVLFKIESPNVAILIGFLNLLDIFSGNIDFLIFFVVLLCLWRNENYTIPILLAFISFKPSVILILPYFLYKSKKRYLFIITYGASWICFNYYFLLHTEYITYFIDYAIPFFSGGFAYLRYTWLWYVYYYWIKEYYNKKNEIPILQRTELIFKTEKCINNLFH